MPNRISVFFIKIIDNKGYINKRSKHVHHAKELNAICVNAIVNIYTFVKGTNIHVTKALFFSVENLGCGMGECGKGGKRMGED